MQKQFFIGSSKKHDIIVKDEACKTEHAVVTYQKGSWILKNIDRKNETFINNILVTNDQELFKYDVIKIGEKKIHWSNYLNEELDQDLFAKDFISFHGRINRTNYRVLSLVVLGLSPIIYLSPGLLIFAERLRLISPELRLELFQIASPLIHTIGFSFLAFIVINLSIKRTRDTGEALWKLLMPIYYLKILFIKKSI